MKEAIIKGLDLIGLDARKIYKNVRLWSVRRALAQQDLSHMLEKLRRLVPDISRQESRVNLNYDNFWELKRRGMHAFQCKLMLMATENFQKLNLTVVDIGDSSGTHMLYLKELTKDRFYLNTLSVNLDPRAIEKIKARGLPAILKRAEDIQPEDLGGSDIDLFTSFQMVEHLHNPLFFSDVSPKRQNATRWL